MYNKYELTTAAMRYRFNMVYCIKLDLANLNLCPMVMQAILKSTERITNITTRSYIILMEVLGEAYL